MESRKMELITALQGRNREQTYRRSRGRRGRDALIHRHQGEAACSAGSSAPDYVMTDRGGVGWWEGGSRGSGYKHS